MPRIHHRRLAFEFAVVFGKRKGAHATKIYRTVVERTSARATEIGCTVLYPCVVTSL